ncbi:MAG: Type 1 glutamine amidotransferase-like domain-containing protein [Actinobacteria bacterium]|nr:Type 1 glutamine amidotransferase-like domain-containing protein [Actinomycetota bacterium]MCB9390448.1 Type 1 glutamine amidotransferase-like domain-containing protein [Acidimicrobiia bacterium]
MSGSTTGGQLVLGGGALLEANAADLRRQLVAAAAERGGSSSLDAVLIPTAAAFEGVDDVTASATAELEALGCRVDVLDGAHHSDFESVAMERIARASVVWIADGSALHLRSVLIDTGLSGAISRSIAAGGVVIADGAGAEVLCDPMIDPRGGAFTVGLGVVRNCSVIGDLESFPAQRRQRSIEMVGPDRWLIGIPATSAWAFQSETGWSQLGSAPIAVLAGPGRTGPTTWDDSPEVHGPLKELVSLE